MWFQRLWNYFALQFDWPVFYSEPKCVNAHDRCYDTDPSTCPYCEVKVI